MVSHNTHPLLLHHQTNKQASTNVVLMGVHQTTMCVCVFVVVQLCGCCCFTWCWCCVLHEQVLHFVLHLLCSTHSNQQQQQAHKQNNTSSRNSMPIFLLKTHTTWRHLHLCHNSNSVSAVFAFNASCSALFPSSLILFSVLYPCCCVIVWHCLVVAHSTGSVLSVLC